LPEGNGHDWSWITIGVPRRKRRTKPWSFLAPAAELSRTGGNPAIQYNPIYVTLWLFNIAMENDPFIDGLPITNGDFPWLC